MSTTTTKARFFAGPADGHVEERETLEDGTLANVYFDIAVGKTMDGKGDGATLAARYREHPPKSGQLLFDGEVKV